MICKESMYIERRPGPSRAGVYVIVDDQTGRVCGKVIYAYPRDGAGMLYASMWDWSNILAASRDVQHGRSGQYPVIYPGNAY